MLTCIAFYFTFALLAAAMTSEEQKNGLRIALALAVVLCLSEVQWLNEEGMNESTSDIDGLNKIGQKFWVLSLLPERYCMFEKVRMSLF